ncbi:ABC transporter permease [Oceanicaulis sp.]|uniref:ABC transporter permease n=1 Tax=Oceanicaulis sp. TaxID=1924941 RepID=UPI003F717F68
MRAAYLIARREYLSYVATWGFWLSLLAVPIFAAIGGLTPALIQSSQPVRYFTVIDETGQGLDQLIEETRFEERRERVRGAIEMMARGMGGDDAAARALAIFDEDPDGVSRAEDALQAVGLSDAASALEAGRTKAVQVDPPAQTVEALRAYLSGDQTVDTPEGPKSLFAAFFIRPHPEQGLELVYLSANLTNNDLRSDVRNILRAHMRETALVSEGLDPDEINAILDIRPLVTSLDVNSDAGEEEEVTFADRAPFFVALGLAFILWMAVFSVANMLLTSMIEEKGGKIIELLLSTARLEDILLGKLVGVAGVSVTLFAVWGGVGVGLSTLGGSALASVDPDLLELLTSVFDPGLLLAGLFFFTCGYLMYGAIFLAMGSLCDTLQDAQTLMGPVIWILMLPMLIIVFSINALDSMVIQIGSWVPLWTPFVMMARLPTDPPFWELAAACALMVATTVLVLWGAAAVFRQGALGHANADSVRKLLKMGGKKKA